MTRFLLLLLTIGLSRCSGMTLEQFFKGAAPENYGTSMELSKKVATSLLASKEPGIYYHVILGTDKAWKQENSARMLRGMKGNADLIQAAVADCIVALPKKARKLADFEAHSDIQTLGGTPIVFHNGGVYFGRFDASGSKVKRTGEKLQIADKPVKELSDGVIFGIKKISFPADNPVRSLSKETHGDVLKKAPGLPQIAHVAA